MFIPTYTYVFTCLSPGPSYFLAGNRLHVLGQWADMETPAVFSGATSGAFNTPTSNIIIILYVWHVKEGLKITPWLSSSFLWHRSLQFGREIRKHQTSRQESDDVLPPLCKMPQTSHRLCSFNGDCFSHPGPPEFSLKPGDYFISWHTSLFYSPVPTAEFKAPSKCQETPCVLLFPHHCTSRTMLELSQTLG